MPGSFTARNGGVRGAGGAGAARQIKGRRRYGGHLPMHRRRLLALPLLGASLTLLANCARPRAQDPEHRLVEVAGGLEHPWALAFLPDGRMLVTERDGRLRLIEDGRLRERPVAGVPEVAAGGQGGLLDIVLHPGFSANGVLYLSYAGATAGGAATHVLRARLEGDRLVGGRVILVGGSGGSGRHFGSRMAFDRAGLLYVSLGDRGQMDRAQDLGDLAGKVVRITDEGAVPPDNPFVGRPGARPEIWCYGVRNPQGLALNPWTGMVWEQEHGPRGGDEINLLRAGANYGWPVITHGVDYTFLPLGEGKAKPGMEQPLHAWVPSIAPSGMAFYDAAAFPAWRGNLLVGALKDELLVRLELDGDRIVREERLLEGEIGRIRDVRVGPDGMIYLLNDERRAGLWRLEPGTRS
jgi:glucose/arabinose dehydrogenase